MSRHRFGLRLSSAVLVLLVASLGGCGGDDDEDEDERDPRPVVGTFVGRAPPTEAFVSVVAAAPARGRGERRVTVFACDGRRICQEFSGPASGNDFTARSRGDGGEASGELSPRAATGTIEPGDGEAFRFEVADASATAGLYDLTVGRDGSIRGASAAGVGLRGSSTLPEPGNGTLRLADGRRLRFSVTRNTGDPVRLRPGQLRLIVLPGGQVRGAARTRAGSGGGGSDFLIRSAR